MDNSSPAVAAPRMAGQTSSPATTVDDRLRERDVLGIVTKRRAQRAKYPPRVPPTYLQVKAEVAAQIKSPATRLAIEKMINAALDDRAKARRARALAFTEETPRPIDEILALAAQITGVSVEDFRSPIRMRRLAWPRHFAMLLLHKARRDLSTPQIGRVFGGRDHTSVMHALKKAEERRGFPEFTPWFADPRAQEIIKGSAETDRAGAP